MAIPKDLPTKPRKMFDNYLFRVGLLDKLNKDSVQYKELQKSFYGALGSILVILNTKSLTESDMFEIMDGIQTNVDIFWKNQIKEKKS